MMDESIWVAMYSWLTPTVLFVFLNLMIGTIAITSSLSSNNNTNNTNTKDPNYETTQIHRSPSSSAIQRLKSINFYSYRSQEPPNTFSTNQHEHNSHSHNLSRSPSVVQWIKSFNFNTYEPPSHELDPILPTQTPEDTQKEEKKQEIEEEPEMKEEEKTLDEVYSMLKGNHMSRTTSDTKPASGEVLKKLPKKMKKSASSKSAFAHFEEMDIVEARRPATVKEEKSQIMEDDDEDGEVDAKADDFINRFKQQLKLQRIDSIVKYKEMVNHRGTTTTTSR